MGNAVDLLATEVPRSDRHVEILSRVGQGYRMDFDSVSGFSSLDELLVAEGRDLYWWHPLISGDPNTVHEAGVSVRDRVYGTEDEIADADLEDHIVQWPAQLPKRARLKKRPSKA